MKLFHCFLLALALLIATPGMAAPASKLLPPLLPLTKDTIQCDNLVLFDLQALPVDKIAKADDQVWVLAQITPQPSKEQKTRYYFPVDLSTGQKSQTPAVDYRLYDEGSFDVKIALTKKTILSENYSVPGLGPFSGPATARFRVIYSPFRASGYAICQVNSNAQGKDRYVPLDVVPAEWQAFVAPAFAFCRANPTLFCDTGTHMTAARRTRLTNLLTSPNPYLAVFACRTLTRAGAVDAGTVDRALLQTDPFRQAAMTYLLLANVPQGDNATALVVEGSIHAITNDARTLDSLNGIALGIGAALNTTGGPATWGARDDLVEARKRLAPDGAADSYVSTLLRGHERTDK